MDKVIAMIVVLFLAFLTQYLWQLYRIPSLEAILESIGAPEDLQEHTKEFEKQEVVKVTDGVYVALNFAIANSILLVGPNESVVVDTTESMDAATEIRAHFRNITSNPTTAIVYTHHHTDHVTGSQAFMDEENPPEIWAHHLLFKEEQRVNNNGRAYFNRAQYQFGTYVKNGFLNCGIGGKLRFDLKRVSRAPPTHLVYEDMNVTLGGMELQLIHIPGETADQLGVWYPEKRVLLAADDIYKAFPNLYAIRGVTPRDVTDWINSLDKMRKLRARCLVGSHYNPLCGEEEIYNLLSDYMYGIQYVHDQTVRYLNKGMHPEEIANIVKLPPELVDHPYLKQYYGTVPWSVKAVFTMYMGWFSGDPVDLNPLPPSKRAVKMMELVGKKGLLQAAESALYTNDDQWALELASHVYTIEPTNSWAIDIRKKAMANLASQQISANGRNFYMTAILKDADKIPAPDVTDAALVTGIDVIFNNIKTRLKAEELPVGEDFTGCFNFTDTAVFRCVHLHKGIAEISKEETPTWKFKFTTKEQVFREIIARKRSPVRSYLFGDFIIEGGILNLRRFFNFIDTP